MNLLARIEGFDWDQGNSEKNWERHKVSFIECEEVFFNRPLVVVEDTPHSKSEGRYFALGKTNDDRYLFVVFTVRNNKIRVISARDMNRKERRVYREEIEKTAKVQE
jgi:uncharacterized protein